MITTYNFVIIDSQQAFADDLKLVLSRTFLDGRVDCLQDIDALQDYGAADVLFFDSKMLGTHASLVQDYLHRNGSARLVATEGPQAADPGVNIHGILKQPVRQADLRQLMRTVLQLPEYIKLGRDFLNPIRQILYVESVNPQKRWIVHIQTHDRVIRYGRQLRELECRLVPYGYVRINTRALVNRAEIKKRERHKGTVRITMSDGKEFLISRHHLDDFWAG
jgi:hypothetical protein